VATRCVRNSALHTAKLQPCPAHANLPTGDSGVQAADQFYGVDPIVVSNTPGAAPSSEAASPRRFPGSRRSGDVAQHGEPTDDVSAELAIWRPHDCTSDERAATSGSHEEVQANLRILQTAAEFEGLRDAWTAWNDCPEADLDFFSIHLRHTLGVVRPHVMVVYRSGRPDCMLVGWLHQGAVPFKVGSLTVFRSDARILRFVNGGFLGNQSRGNSRFLVREIIKSLHNREAQAVEFSQLRVDSPLYDLATREPNVFCREHFTPLQAHRYVTLPATLDRFPHGLSRKRRQQFTRHARMLIRDFPGKVRFQSIRSENDVEDFARKADEISQKTYQRALGAGFVNDLEMREILRAAAQKKALRACLLYIDERPVAFTSGIVSNKTLYGTCTGFDPAFKKYRPGLQTLVRFIEESFEPSGSLLRVDAGCGDVPYKRALFDSNWKESPVWIFAPSAAGLRLHVLKAVSTLLHYSAMELLARSEHLRMLKKMWHRRAVRQFQEKTI
jgi:Acetyltransferase (GNAT) domain